MARIVAFLGVVALVAGTSLLGSGQAHADVLLIDRVNAEQSIPTPNRGMTMVQVEQRFGTPAEKRPPVGGNRPQHPPITRWVYPQFSVYFEHDRVVDTVVNRASPQETGPKPVR